MTKYTPTGYGPGRPRKGEIRPPSPNAIKTAKYRKARHERDPSYKDHLAQEQREWRANNLERSREISRNTYWRKKGFTNLEERVYITQPSKVERVF